MKWWHILLWVLLGYVLGYWMPKFGNMVGLNKIYAPKS